MMLLDADRSQLLVVDVQARLLPAMSEPEAVLASGRILLAAAAASAGRTLATVHR